jgi:ABC-type uncharacterized transport system substrate-binding protein
MNTLSRAFVAIAALALAYGALPVAAQPSTKLPRIAYVWLFGQGPSAPYADAFRERMSELGWVEGKTIQSEYIDAGGNGAKLDAIMEGLVRDKVDIIVAMCTPEALSAKKFTTTIPIIMAATDPRSAACWRRSTFRRRNSTENSPGCARRRSFCGAGTTPSRRCRWRTRSTGASPDHGCT